MMKITTQHDDEATTLKLEGALAGEWVRELLHSWYQTTAAPEHEPLRPIRIDLTGVTFVDQAGQKLLALIHRNGAELIAVGLLTKAIVEEITRGEAAH